MMPIRPREHQIEDLSRLAFRSKLPAQWVFRDFSSDYGIDGEVEIFKDDGSGTGQRFLVQLKATDEPKLARALKVRLRFDAYHYYYSLETPVLIVRYHVLSERLFSKWFHKFDPYYQRKARNSSKPPKTFTFQLAIEDEWQNCTAVQLRATVESIRKIRAHQLHIPVRFCLTIAEPSLLDLSSLEIATDVREAAKRVNNLIAILKQGEESDGGIKIDQKEIRVDLAGFKNCVLHPKEYATGSKEYTSDIFLGIAITLDAAGYREHAAEIIAQFANTSALVRAPFWALNLALCMARANRITEALQLAEFLFEGEFSSDSAQFAILPLLQRQRSESQDELALLSSVFLRISTNLQVRGKTSLAATARYNLAQQLKGGGKTRESVREYLRAAELDPHYWKRGYFLRELAGVLFESRRFKAAASFYQKAIEFGEMDRCHAQFADALMFSGKYSEALIQFEAYIAKAHPPKAEWKLKQWAITQILQDFGITTQKRDPKAAALLCDLSPESANHSEQLKQAVRQDAVCGLAWFNLGVLSEKDSPALAAKYFLLAAISEKNDIQAWTAAVAISIFSRSLDGILFDMFSAAYFIHSENFVKGLIELAKKQGQGFPVSQFFDVVNAIIAAMPAPDKNSFELRLLQEGTSDYRSLTISGTDKKNAK